MKQIILPATVVVLLALATYFGFFKSEPEKYIDRFVAAINDASDSLAQVKDGPSARAAIDDIDHKLMVLRDLLRELPSQMEKGKHVKVTKFTEDALIRAMTNATDRFQNELKRITEIPDLPEEFISHLANSFLNLAAVGQSGSEAAIDRMMFSRMISQRQMQRAQRSHPGANISIPPPQTPPETPAQREERERRQREARAQGQGGKRAFFARARGGQTQSRGTTQRGAGARPE